MATAERVLIVDDEPGIRELLAVLFEREGYATRACDNARDALDAVTTWNPSVVVSDVNMPGMDGMDLLRAVRAGPHDVPVILVTAYGNVASAVAAMREGAFDYVAKPFLNDELRLIVRKALAMRKLESDNARMRAALGERYALGQMVGNSPAMQEVYTLVRRIMGTRINCLVCGESGTGKELLARALHYGSDRARQAFVPVNCGAIPENLVESELFGHKKGSFTGAVRDREGFFAAADGGTLFLDEVGELPASAQVKVLRALAERKIVAVGDTTERPVDVRIVAATNRDLRAEVAAGRFREDLYYRLNVVQIDMPPLRDRREDVPALAAHFLERFTKEYGKDVRGFHTEAIRQLTTYAFPGNVRELQNVLERAVALEPGVLITSASLPERVRGAMAQVEGAVPDENEPFDTAGVDLEARLAEVERGFLERALHATSGNRTQAAKLLGISFRSFRYRLAKFGMDEGDPGDEKRQE